MKLGPGLAKTRGARLVEVRRVKLAKGCAARWRALFESADVVSEGSARDEAKGAVWYGSTSVILAFPVEDLGETLDPELIAQFAARDPHLRLRAIRAAVREASVRAPGALGSAVCDVKVMIDLRGVRIDVDVQAPLIQGGAATRRRRRTDVP